MTWDRLKIAVEAIVNELVGQRLDYLARYPAVVTLQSGATLSCKPDDQRLPTLVGVKLRYGVPGLVLQVPPGSRVLIGFDAGDPSKPFAELWDTTVPITIALTAAASVTLTAPTITLSGALAVGAMSPAPGTSDMTIDAGAKPLNLTNTLAPIAIGAVSTTAITLGGGVQGVARIGDAVQVNPATGTGTIIAGSTKVFA